MRCKTNLCVEVVSIHFGHLLGHLYSLWSNIRIPRQVINVVSTVLGSRLAGAKENMRDISGRCSWSIFYEKRNGNMRNFPGFSAYQSQSAATSSCTIIEVKHLELTRFLFKFTQNPSNKQKRLVSLYNLRMYLPIP